MSIVNDVGLSRHGVNWKVRPYLETGSHLSGAHLGAFDITSSMSSLSPDSLTSQGSFLVSGLGTRDLGSHLYEPKMDIMALPNFTVPNNQIWRRALEPVPTPIRDSIFTDIRESSSLAAWSYAYSHTGVGEKGPHSRWQAKELGTYKSRSQTDPLKAAQAGAFEVAHRLNPEALISEAEYIQKMKKLENIKGPLGSRQIGKWLSGLTPPAPTTTEDIFDKWNRENAADPEWERKKAEAISFLNSKREADAAREIELQKLRGESQNKEWDSTWSKWQEEWNEKDRKTLDWEKKYNKKHHKSPLIRGTPEYEESGKLPDTHKIRREAWEVPNSNMPPPSTPPPVPPTTGLLEDEPPNYSSILRTVVGGGGGGEPPVDSMWGAAQGWFDNNRNLGYGLAALGVIGATYGTFHAINQARDRKDEARREASNISAKRWSATNHKIYSQSEADWVGNLSRGSGSNSDDDNTTDNPLIKGSKFLAGHWTLLHSAYLFRKGWLEAAKGSENEPTIGKAIAGLAHVSGSYPRLFISFGTGKAVRSLLGYAAGDQTLGQFVSSLPWVAKEAISYPVSKYISRELVRYPEVREGAAKLLEGMGAFYKSLGERFGSDWAMEKSRSVSMSAGALRDISGKISGSIVAALGEETLGRAALPMQEIIDPVIDIASFYAMRSVLTPVGRWLDRHLGDKDNSVRMAYSHAGVGEKGPHSRSQADQLGTYKSHSVAAAARIAVLGVAKRIYKGEVKPGVKPVLKLSREEKEIYANNIKFLPDYLKDTYSEIISLDPRLVGIPIFMGDIGGQSGIFFTLPGFPDLTRVMLNPKNIEGSFYNPDMYPAKALMERAGFPFTPELRSKFFMAHEFGHAQRWLDVGTAKFAEEVNDPTFNETLDFRNKFFPNSVFPKGAAGEALKLVYENVSYREKAAEIYADKFAYKTLMSMAYRGKLQGANMEYLNKRLQKGLKIVKSGLYDNSLERLQRSLRKPSYIMKHMGLFYKNVPDIVEFEKSLLKQEGFSYSEGDWNLEEDSLKKTILSKKLGFLGKIFRSRNNNAGAFHTVHTLKVSEIETAIRRRTQHILSQAPIKASAREALRKSKALSSYLVEHWGVGEKGPASRLLAKILGTFKPHSTVDAYKVALEALAWKIYNGDKKTSQPFTKEQLSSIRQNMKTLSLTERKVYKAALRLEPRLSSVGLFVAGDLPGYNMSTRSIDIPYNKDLFGFVGLHLEGGILAKQLRFFGIPETYENVNALALSHELGHAADHLRLSEGDLFLTRALNAVSEEKKMAWSIVDTASSSFRVNQLRLMDLIHKHTKLEKMADYFSGKVMYESFRPDESSRAGRFMSRAFEKAKSGTLADSIVNRGRSLDSDYFPYMSHLKLVARQDELEEIKGFYAANFISRNFGSTTQFFSNDDLVFDPPSSHLLLPPYIEKATEGRFNAISDASIFPEVGKYFRGKQYIKYSIDKARKLGKYIIQHWGVGEKGWASRLLAKILGTFKSHSVVDALKAALLTSNLFTEMRYMAEDIRNGPLPYFKNLKRKTAIALSRGERAKFLSSVRGRTRVLSGDARKSYVALLRKYPILSDIPVESPEASLVLPHYSRTNNVVFLPKRIQSMPNDISKIQVTILKYGGLDPGEGEELNMFVEGGPSVTMKELARSNPWLPGRAAKVYGRPFESLSEDEINRFVLYHELGHAYQTGSQPVELVSLRGWIGKLNQQRHLIRKKLGFRALGDNLSVSMERLGEIYKDNPEAAEKDMSSFYIRIPEEKYADKFARKNIRLSKTRRHSHRIAFSHWGVGEKGWASRLLANILGTFKPHSTVDPLKAANMYESIHGLPNLGDPNAMRSSRPYENINLIGVEFEGAWQNSPSLLELYHKKFDRTVEFPGFPSNYIGEITLGPMKPQNISNEFLIAYPSHVNKQTALHIHFSFKNPLSYFNFYSQEAENLLLTHTARTLEKGVSLGRIYSPEDVDNVRQTIAMSIRSNKVFNELETSKVFPMERYRPLNLHSLLAHGTFEFRQPPMLTSPTESLVLTKSIINLVNRMANPTERSRYLMSLFYAHLIANEEIIKKADVITVGHSDKMNWINQNLSRAHGRNIELPWGDSSYGAYYDFVKDLGVSPLSKAQFESYKIATTKYYAVNSQNRRHESLGNDIALGSYLKSRKLAQLESSYLVKPNRHYLSNIDRIGVELEGAWKEDTQFPNWVDFKSDGSVRVTAEGLKVGEIGLGAYTTSEWRDKFLSLHPYAVNESTGMHVHVSFKNIYSYYNFYSQEAQNRIIGSLSKFRDEKIASGELYDPHEIQNLNSRLRGESKYASLFGDGETLTRFSETRYRVINFFSFVKHHTIEFRVLPMFKDPNLGAQFVDRLLSEVHSMAAPTYKSKKMLPIFWEHLIRDFVERKSVSQRGSFLWALERHGLTNITFSPMEGKNIFANLMSALNIPNSDPIFSSPSSNRPSHVGNPSASPSSPIRPTPPRQWIDPFEGIPVERRYLVSGAEEIRAHLSLYSGLNTRIEDMLAWESSYWGNRVEFMASIYAASDRFRETFSAYSSRMSGIADSLMSLATNRELDEYGVETAINSQHLRPYVSFQQIPSRDLIQSITEIYYDAIGVPIELRDPNIGSRIDAYELPNSLSHIANRSQYFNRFRTNIEVYTREIADIDRRLNNRRIARKYYIRNGRSEALGRSEDISYRESVNSLRSSDLDSYPELSNWASEHERRYRYKIMDTFQKGKYLLGLAQDRLKRSMGRFSEISGSSITPNSGLLTKGKHYIRYALHKSRQLGKYIIQHWGVGEKGWASRLWAKILGTFKPHSTVDPLAASQLAEKAMQRHRAHIISGRASRLINNRLAKISEFNRVDDYTLMDMFNELNANLSPTGRKIVLEAFKRSPNVALLRFKFSEDLSTSSASVDSFSGVVRLSKGVRMYTSNRGLLKKPVSSITDSELADIVTMRRAKRAIWGMRLDYETYYNFVLAHELGHVIDNEQIFGGNWNHKAPPDYYTRGKILSRMSWQPHTREEYESVLKETNLDSSSPTLSEKLKMLEIESPNNMRQLIKKHIAYNIRSPREVSADKVAGSILRKVLGITEKRRFTIGFKIAEGVPPAAIEKIPPTTLGNMGDMGLLEGKIDIGSSGFGNISDSFSSRTDRLRTMSLLTGDSKRVAARKAKAVSRWLSEHWGVGEKGWASRLWAKILGTFKRRSTVDPLKAAQLAEKAMQRHRAHIESGRTARLVNMRLERFESYNRVNNVLLMDTFDKLNTSLSPTGRKIVLEAFKKNPSIASLYFTFKDDIATSDASIEAISGEVTLSKSIRMYTTPRTLAEPVLSLTDEAIGEITVLRRAKRAIWGAPLNPETYYNFVLAHELGHLISSKTGYVEDYSYRDSSEGYYMRSDILSRMSWQPHTREEYEEVLRNKNPYDTNYILTEKDSRFLQESDSNIRQLVKKHMSYTGHNPIERDADIVAGELLRKVLGIKDKRRFTLGFKIAREAPAINSTPGVEITSGEDEAVLGISAKRSYSISEKVAVESEVRLAATRRNSRTSGVPLETIKKAVFEKFNVSENDLYYWLRNNTATRRLRGRGIDLHEIRTLLSSFKRSGRSDMSTERRVFLSGTEKRAIIRNDTRQIMSAPSGVEYSGKMAFDNMAPKTPVIYGAVQPVSPPPDPHIESHIAVPSGVAGESTSIVSKTQGIPPVKVKSHVSVKVTDAKADIEKIEKLIIGRLLK